MKLTIEPLTPLIGAEIKGVDVTKITNEEFAGLFQAFTDHSVLFLRNQPQMSAEQHRTFAQRFGEIHIHPAARGKPGEHPGAMKMRTNSESKVAAGNRWHSDVSCDAKPPQASILQLHQIPPLGGDTLFASLYAAYEALSDHMKVYLDGLTALHSGEEAFRHVFQFEAADKSARWPENHHPVTRRHSDSGRPALFVDREFTKSIDGLPKEEGKALLAFLFSHVERVDFQCRFRWSENAIAIWDNRCALHHAMWDYYPEERSGRRVSVIGEVPLAWHLGSDQVPASRFAAAKLTI